MVFISSWVVHPSDFLSLVITFVWKPVLSDISIATPALLCLQILYYIFVADRPCKSLPLDIGRAFPLLLIKRMQHR